MNPRLKFLMVLVIGLSGVILEVPHEPAQERVERPATPRGSREAPAGPDRQARESSGGPHAILNRAIVALEDCHWISAKTRQRVELFGKQLVGSGTYVEQRTAQGRMFRLELKTQLGDEASILLQACDGRHLWVYEKYHDKPTLVRIDVAQVMQALEERGGLPHPGEMEQWPGLGGLPRLLRGLEAAFDFTSAEEVRLGDQLPAVRLRGEWKAQRLAQILPEQQQAITVGRGANLDKMSPHLPHYVVLYLEQPGLFPRRIEYWRRQPKSGRLQEPAPDKAIVTMDLFDVNINVPIAANFSFDPGNLDYADQTERFLESTGLAKKSKPTAPAAGVQPEQGRGGQGGKG